jgi:hypothetical protein
MKEFDDTVEDMINEKRPPYKVLSCEFGLGCNKPNCRYAHADKDGVEREVFFFRSKFGFDVDDYEDNGVPDMLRKLIPPRLVDIKAPPQSTKTSFAVATTTKMPQLPKGKPWADDLSEQDDTMSYAKVVEEPQPGNNASSSKDIDVAPDDKEEEPQPGNNASSSTNIDAWSDGKVDEPSVAVVEHGEDDVQSNISSLRSVTSRKAHSEPSRVKPDMPILNIEREAEPTNDMPHTPTVWNQPQQQQNTNMVLVPVENLQMLFNEIKTLQNEVRDARRAITEMQYEMADMRRSMRA